MAGSYNHVVNKDSSLRTAEQINDSLECLSGDVVEAVEEMYGMIWYLAEGSPEKVEQARQNWRAGYKLSPTNRKPYC